MATAVVYYSATGNCALAGKALAEKLGAKLIELKEAKQRNLSKVNAAFMMAGFQAAMGIRTKLQGQPWQDASGCDVLHLIVPVWASKPAPAINTFISKSGFQGKRVFLYTVQADPKDTAQASREKLAAKIRNLGGSITGSYGLTGSAPGKEPDDGIAKKICGL